MLRFAKGGEPETLKAWRSTPDASYDSLRTEDKAEVRRALLRDQGHLCCYCQRGITGGPEEMRVEHWVPQSSGRDSLRWRNLLGTCHGNAQGHGGPLHCDAARGNRALFLHPVVDEGPDPRAYLRYLGNGEVTSDEQRAREDVVEALKLNAGHLRAARVAVVEALRTRIERKGWSKGTLARELKRLDDLRPGDAWPAFVEVARYHLRRWLHRLDFRQSIVQAGRQFSVVSCQFRPAGTGASACEGAGSD